MPLVVRRGKKAAAKRSTVYTPHDVGQLPVEATHQSDVDTKTTRKREWVDDLGSPCESDMLLDEAPPVDEQEGFVVNPTRAPSEETSTVSQVVAGVVEALAVSVGCFEARIAVVNAVQSVLDGLPVTELRVVHSWAMKLLKEDIPTKRRRVEPTEVERLTHRDTEKRIRAVLELVERTVVAMVREQDHCEPDIVIGESSNSLLHDTSVVEAIAENVRTLCHSITDSSLSAVDEVVGKARRDVLNLLEPSATIPHAVLLPMSPPAMAVSALVLRSSLAHKAALDMCLSRRFICSAARQEFVSVDWVSETVAALCEASICALPQLPVRPGSGQALSPARWPLTLGPARRAFGRAFLYSARNRDCPLSTTTIAHLACQTTKKVVGGADDMRTTCFELAGAHAESAVDWLWVAMSAVYPDQATASQVWRQLVECGAHSTDEGVELATTLLEQSVGQDALGVSASPSLITMFCDPALHSVITKAVPANRELFERAATLVMSTFAQLASSHRAVDTLLPYHPQHYPAAQIASVLAAVITTRVECGSAVAAAVRWSTKVVGSGDKKTVFGRLFRDCPADAVRGLVRIAKRLIEDDTIDSTSKKATFKLLGWLTETKGSLAALLAENVGCICTPPIENGRSANAALALQMAVEHAIANGLLRPLMQNFTPGVVARLVRAALLGAKNDSTFACTESVVQLLADACCHSTDLRARVGLPQAELLLDSALYLLTSEETTMAMADSLEAQLDVLRLMSTLAEVKDFRRRLCAHNALEPVIKLALHRLSEDAKAAEESDATASSFSLIHLEKAQQLILASPELSKAMSKIPPSGAVGLRVSRLWDRLRLSSM